jgi:two-component system nitrogen regulation response regulator GlnG
MDGTVLVADDDRTIRTVLTQALTRAGCRVHATASLMTLLRWVEEGKGDLVITDVVMPDGNGLQMLPRITALRPNLPVIVISAQNTIMTAIQAAEAEAWDYLPKPFDLPDLMKRAARALDQRGKGAMRPAVAQAAAAVAEDLPLVGKTPAMQALYRLVAKVMNTDIAVLVTGESGTGKSLIAKAIHDFSDRRQMPFVVAQATDFDQADRIDALRARARGGSLVIDEVGDLDDLAQGRLARMIDAFGDGAPRILATSQVDLGERITQGRFRQDLYYRLGGVVISVPALRERVDDIVVLADHFLARAARDTGQMRRLTPEASAVLRAAAWPGNVRQLENLLRRLTLANAAQEITRTEVEAALGESIAIAPPTGIASGETLSEAVARHIQRYFDLHGGALPPPGVYQRILREIEVPMIEIALDATGGNQARCADLLGINRNTLRKKITELDIQVTRRRKLM